LLGKPIWQSSPKTQKGAALERKFEILFLAHGYEVRRPAGHSTWDLEVVLPSGIKRIQVKSGFWHQNLWYHKTKKTKTFKDGSQGGQPYLRTDFDYLGFDGPDGEFYLVPMPELHDSQITKDALPTTCSSLHKRYSHYKVNVPNQIENQPGPNCIQARPTKENTPR
jgi:hypothetical protein